MSKLWTEDMPPGLPGEDIADSASRNAILSGNGGLAGRPVDIAHADLAHLRFCKLCLPVPFATQPLLGVFMAVVALPTRHTFRMASREMGVAVLQLFRMRLCYMPAFVDHILGVIRSSSQEEMRGIDTGRVITVMTDAKPPRDRANAEFIGDTRCPFQPCSNTDMAIAFGVCACHPQPTPIRASGLVNLGPKTLRERALARLVRTGSTTIFSKSTRDLRRNGREVSTANLTNAIKHLAPLTKGDTHDLGRFLLREPAQKIMGVIKKKAAPRYRFPQHPEYSIFQQKCKAVAGV